MKKLMAATMVALGMVCAAGVASAGPVFDLTATTTLTANNTMRGTFPAGSMLMGSIELTDAAAMRIMMGVPTMFTSADIANFQFTVGALTLNRAGAMNID